MDEQKERELPEEEVEGGGGDLKYELAVLAAAVGVAVGVVISILLFGVDWNGEQGEQEVVTVRCSNPTGLRAVEMQVRKDYIALSHDGFLYRNNRTGTTIVYNSAPGEMCALLPIEGTVTLEE